MQSQTYPSPSLVSIPHSYDTNSEEFIRTKVEMLEEFQFLIVTIQTLPNHPFSMLFAMFQFLIVTIQTAPENSLEVQANVFQFLIVTIQT